MNNTILSFLTFTGLVGLITWYMTRKDDHQSSDGYFLGGRSLTFPIIAGSLLLTNLSTEQLVGLNGAAYSGGLHVMVWEVVAVVALVLMALYFLPRFLRSGIATVPQYLGERYDRQTRLIVDIIFLIAYAVILLPIILYTGAKGLSSMLDIGALTGIQNDTLLLWLMVALIGTLGSIYAIFGGLRTVAVSDTLNGAGLLIGGFLIAYFGLQAVSENQGAFSGLTILQQAAPERFNSIGSADQSVPFATIFSGVMLLNLFYWCTNQQIIQRTLAASSLEQGQKGVLLTAGLKLLGPVYLVIPGMIAYHLYSSDPNFRSVDAYGTLVRDVLPTPLTGFFAAAMVGAILSSFNSALNSTSTIFSLGFYGNVINKQASEEKIVRSGKWFALVIAVCSMAIAPLLDGQGQIFEYLQKMNGIYFVPLFAVVVMGMLFKRLPPLAAKAGLLTGFTIIPFGYFVPVAQYLNENGETVSQFISGDLVNDYHFLGIAFLLITSVMLLINRLKPMESDFIQKEANAVDMTPWKHSQLTGVVLLVLVIIIYAQFADFSVL
jgi:SSS family solute:Na+ symporter